MRTWLIPAAAVLLGMAVLMEALLAGVSARTASLSSVVGLHLPQLQVPVTALHALMAACLLILPVAARRYSLLVYLGLIMLCGRSLADAVLSLI